MQRPFDYSSGAVKTTYVLIRAVLVMRALGSCRIGIVPPGIQHRSEAAVLPLGYGHSPGELDCDLFLHEQPEPAQY
jgi:hypothetical protein